MIKTATSKVPPPPLLFIFLHCITDHSSLNAIYYLDSRNGIFSDGNRFSLLFLIIIIIIIFSQEEYLDFQSFEVRIKSILNQMFGRPNNPPSSAGMMVQTPGASHGWGQTHTATPMVNTSTFNNNNNLADAATEAGRLLPTNRMNGGNVTQIRC